MHFHAQILLAFGACLSLVTFSVAAPALKYNGPADICSITTVYVTVSATGNTINLHQLPTNSLSEYSLLPVPNSTGTADVVTSLSGSTGDVSTHVTTTVHQIVSLTHTTTEPILTVTETLGGDDSQFTSLPTNGVYQTYVSGHEDLSSVDAVTTGTPSVTSARNIGYGDTTKLHSTTTALSLTDSTAGTGSKSPYNPLTSVGGSGASGAISGSTSVPSVVYVVQTLTVIPLATIPSNTIIGIETTTTVPDSVILSTKAPLSTEELSSPSSVYGDLSSIPAPTIYGAVVSGSAAGRYSKSRNVNWNTSLPLSAGYIGASVSSSVSTEFSSTASVGPLSSGLIFQSGTSSKSFNFSNTDVLSIPTSSLAAHSGFTAFPTSSNTSTSMKSSAASIPTSFVVYLSSSSSQSPPLSSSTVSSGAIALSSAVSRNSSLSSVALNLTLTYLPSSAGSTAVDVSSSDTCLPTPGSASAFSGISSSSTQPTATAIPTNTSTYTGLNITPSFSLSAPYTTLSGTSVTASSTAATSSISSGPSLLSSSTSGRDTTSILVHSTPSSSTPFTSNSSSTSSTSSVVSKTPSNTPTVTVPSSILSFVTSTISSSATTSSGSTGLVSVLNATSTSATSSSLPTPTSCGEQGPLNLNFDDLPPLSAFDNSTAQPMPLFSPYHQFYFSDGFTVVPPPTDPYNPSSGRLLLEYYADPAAPLGTTGSIGSGPAELLGCFNFNVLGLSVGCDSVGPDCDWHFTGFRYNNVTMKAEQVTTQDLATPACPALSNCKLVPITLDTTFKNMTEIHIHLTVSGEDKIWWIDDLNLSWFDSSCTAGLCRQGHK